MNITLASIFRNSTTYLDRYFAQVGTLERALLARGDRLRLILAEGDSYDGTWEELKAQAGLYRAICFRAAHGGLEYGSVDLPARWRQIAWVCNQVLDRVTREDEAVIYVESDIVWEAETLLSLLAHLAVPVVSGANLVDAVVPMCFHRYAESRYFYDVWGFRKDGAWFTHFPPYHPGLRVEGLTPIDSAGSCIVMRGEVARAARFQPEDGIVGFGRDLHAKGFRLWLDPTLVVVHP